MLLFIYSFDFETYISFSLSRFGKQIKSGLPVPAIMPKPFQDKESFDFLLYSHH